MGYWERMADLQLRGSEQQAANVRQNWQTIGSIVPQTIGAMQDYQQQEQQRKYYATVQERQENELNEARRAQALNLDMDELTSQYAQENGMVDYTGMTRDVNQRKGADFEGPTQLPRLHSSPGAVLNAIRPRYLEQSQVATDMYANEQTILAGIIDDHRIQGEELLARWDKDPSITNAQKAMEWQKLRGQWVAGFSRLPDGVGDNLEDYIPDYSGVLDRVGPYPTGSAFKEDRETMESLGQTIPFQAAEGIPSMTLEDFDEDVIRGLIIKGQTAADLANRSSLVLSQHQIALDQGFYGLDPTRSGNQIMAKVREVLPHMLHTAGDPEGVDQRIETYLQSVHNEPVREFIRGRLEALDLDAESAAHDGMGGYKNTIRSWNDGSLPGDTSEAMNFKQAVWFAMSGERTVPAANTVEAYQLYSALDDMARVNGEPATNVSGLFRDRKRNQGPPDLTESYDRLNRSNDEISDQARATRSFIINDIGSINDPTAANHTWLMGENGLPLSGATIKEIHDSDPVALMGLLAQQEQSEKMGNINSEAHNFNIMGPKRMSEELLGFLSESNLLVKMMDELPDEAVVNGYPLASYRDMYDRSVEANKELMFMTGTREGDAISLFNELAPEQKRAEFKLFMGYMGGRLSGDDPAGNPDELSRYEWDWPAVEKFYERVYGPVIGGDFFTQNLNADLGQRRSAR